MKRWLADTGALVALLDRSDLHHDWAVQCFKKIPAPLLTCESVLAEASHLLSDLTPSIDALSRFHKEGVLRVDFDFETHGSAVWRLVQKYRDLPMDLADACLVRMSELHDDCVVWTTDTHFRVYRRHGRHTVPLLIP